MGFVLGMQGPFNIRKLINVIHHINRRKGEKNTESSHLKQKKHLTKSNNPLIVKNTQKISNRRELLQHDRIHLCVQQNHSQHYTQWWKTESFSPKIKNKTRMPTLTTIIQHSFGSFSHSKQRRKRNKRNPNQKRRIKLSLFADVILYIETPKDATRKLLKLTNESSKVAG